MHRMKQLSRREVFIQLLGIAATFAILFVFLFYYDIETLRTHVYEAGLSAFALILVFKAATVVVAPLGGSPLYPLAGAVLGFWPAFWVLLIGDVLGACIAYFLGRRFGRGILAYFFPDETHGIHRILGTFSSLRGLIITRFVLIGLPEFFAYGAGFAASRFVHFFLVYAIVEAGITALLVSLGAIFAEQALAAILAVMVGVAAIAFFAAPFFVHYIPLHKDSSGSKSDS